MRLGLALFLLSACGTALEPLDAGPIDGGMPRLELGTGTTGFVPIPENGELELVMGPQGGFHIDLTARIWDLNIEGALISYSGTPVGGTTPISFPTDVVLDSTMVIREGDHWLRNDRLIFMITGPADITGMQLDVRVGVQCVSGLGAEDTRQVTIVDNV